MNSVTPLAAAPLSGYEALPMTVVVEGRYFGIANFLGALRTKTRVSNDTVRGKGRLYSVDQVQFAGSPEERMLQATMTLNAYRFSGAAAAARGARRHRRDHERLYLRSSCHGPLMSTIGYAQRRGLREAAAKERRKKLLAFGGVGLLGLVLLIQVPRTLDMMSSDGSSATSSSVVVTATPTPQPAAEAPRPRPRFLRTARVDDPFAGSRAGSRGIPSRCGRRPARPARSVPASLSDPGATGSSRPATHRRRHAGQSSAEDRLHRRARLDPDVQQPGSGGAVRPHGPSTRHRQRRRPQVVCA